MGKPDPSMDIESLKAKRTKDRSRPTKFSNDLKRLYIQVDQGNQKADRHELDYTIELAEGHLSQMEELNMQLSELGVEDVSPHYAELHKAVGMGKRLLSEFNKTNETVPVVTQVVAPRNNFKLNFTLPKLNGELMGSWTEFLELFEASVHQNSAYPPVQKMYFLRQHLEGTAARSIQGLQLTADSYETTIQILKERFGKNSLRKETVIAKLLNLPAVGITENLKSLRRLVDDVSAGIASLKTLNAEPGDILLPVLKGKIPASWRLQWARQRGQSSSQEQDEFAEFLLFLQKEMGYLEEAARVPCGKTSEDNSPPAQKATTTALNTQRVRASPTQQLCPLCKGSHRLDKCPRCVEMTVEERWTTARQVGACFRCLGRHFIRNCRSGNCRQCQGSHHTSLHRPQASTPPTTPAPPTRSAPFNLAPSLTSVPTPPTSRPSVLQSPRSVRPPVGGGQHSHPNMR